jgi:hypothetical protein
MKQGYPVYSAIPDESRPAATTPPRKRSRVAVGVLCFWAAAALAGGAGGAYRMATAYRRFASSALGDNIRYVELHAEPGRPAVRLSRPAEIDAIRGWLRSADRSAPTGVPVRPAECPLTIVFGDGAAETMQIGRTEPTPPGAAAEIEIRWHGYTRYADAQPIATLLQPESAK